MPGHCSQAEKCSLQDSFNAATGLSASSPAASYGVFGNPSLGFGAAPAQASPPGYGSAPGPSPVLASGQIPIYRPSNQVWGAEDTCCEMTSLSSRCAHRRASYPCHFSQYVWRNSEHTLCPLRVIGLQCQSGQSLHAR